MFFFLKLPSTVLITPILIRLFDIFKKPLLFYLGQETVKHSFRNSTIYITFSDEANQSVAPIIPSSYNSTRLLCSLLIVYSHLQADFV